MPLDPGANLPLLKFLLLFLLLVFFPLAGLLTAGATVSFLYDLAGRRDRDETTRRLGASLARGALLSGGAALLLLVLAALTLLVATLAYELPTAAGRLLAPLLGTLAAGLALLYLYRSRPDRWIISLLAGGAGLALLVASLFLLANAEALLLHPESLPLLSILPELLVSWTGTARFFSLTALSFAIAAVALPHLAGDAAAAGRIGGISRALLLVTLVLWPPAVLFELWKLPAVARSAAVFALAGAGIALAAAAFLLLLGRRAEGRPRAVPTLVLLAFGVWIVWGHLARGNALGGPAHVAATAFGPLAVTRAAPPAVEPTAPAAPDVEAGKAVFERICSTCHRLDTRLVGPPLQEVVPKYRGRPEDLRDFIRNPVKVNPEYPAMPKLGLSEAEIAAVAAWLLQEVGE